MPESDNEYPSLEIVSIEEQTLIFQGLLALIEKGTGAGLHNADPGHSIYEIEYNSESSKREPFLSHPPERDTLFCLLKRISRSMREYGNDDTVWYKKIETWSDYQKLVQNPRSKN